MLVHKTYQMRAYTSKAGYSRISNVLNVCRGLHNTLLAEAKAVYRLTGKSMGRYGRQRHLTTLRAKSQELSDIDSRVERGALRRLDKAFDNFFARIDEHRATLARRIREKKKPRRDGSMPGFPRFKPRQRYTCLELSEVGSGMVKGNRVKIKGLPLIRLKPSLSLPDDTPVAMRIMIHGRKLSVSLTYQVETSHLPKNDKAVGIDMGINKRLTLSTGDVIARRETDLTTERRLQRAVSRKKYGSNSRRKAVARFANVKRRNSVCNRNDCHQISTDIVREHGFIVVEDLEIKNMTRAGSVHKRGLNREILLQGWGTLFQQLIYKAEWAGRKLVKVNPAYTSRICSECGFTNGKAREYLIFRCSECGHVADRDVNAALNILKRGWEFAAGSITDGLPSVLPESYARST